MFWKWTQVLTTFFPKHCHRGSDWDNQFNGNALRNHFCVLLGNHRTDIPKSSSRRFLSLLPHKIICICEVQVHILYVISIPVYSDSTCFIFIKLWFLVKLLFWSEVIWNSPIKQFKGHLNTSLLYYHKLSQLTWCLWRKQAIVLNVT